jgi:hypothetical protein
VRGKSSTATDSFRARRYEKYRNFKVVAGLAIFSIPQWIQFLKDSSMLEEHNEDFSAREAMLAFFNSRMAVVDEVKSRNKYISLNFVDFVEAIARVTDMITVPLDSDLEFAGAKNMVHYKLLKANNAGVEVKVEVKKRLLTRRPSTEFLAESKRPLAEKLDKAIKLIIGNLGVVGKGVLQHEKHRIHLVPGYVLEEQIVKEV